MYVYGRTHADGCVGTAGGAGAEPHPQDIPDTERRAGRGGSRDPRPGGRGAA